MGRQGRGRLWGDRGEGGCGEIGKREAVGR